MGTLSAEARSIESAIPGLRALSPLSRGGQKVVYTASHDRYGQVVAKVVRGDDERAMREIQVATDCDIPHTARLYEWGRIDFGEGPVTYILEEFIPGVTLRQELQSRTCLQVDVVIALLRSLLEAAIAMESAGIVHRDIKPENIMLHAEGGFRLLDFGIARLLGMTSLTDSRDCLGPHTPGYAAPEQFRNRKGEIDIRADLFSAGVVAYECLSGCNPFVHGARDCLEVWRRTESTSPPALLADEPGRELGRLIAVLMSRYPSRRPRSAADAKKWLEEAAGNLSAE